MNQEKENVDEAQIGRVLHFVIDKGSHLQCRPALVVHDWPDQGKPGYVNLVVFTDGTNDGRYGTDLHTHVTGAARAEPANVSLLERWETSVLPNHATKVHRSWHWPRECHSLVDAMPPYEKAGEKHHHNHGKGVLDQNNCYACQLEVQSTVRT